MQKELMKIVEKGNKKALISPNYNYIYDKVTGFFARWDHVGLQW